MLHSLHACICMCVFESNPCLWEIGFCILLKKELLGNEITNVQFFQVNGTQVTNSNHIEVVRLIKGKKSGRPKGRKTKERVENIRKLVDYVGEDNIHCTYHCSGHRRPVDCLRVYVPLSHCQQWQFPPSPLILSKCLIHQCK